MFLVVYCKISDDKSEGIELSTVYFGGVCATQEEADNVATECVSNTQGGIIIPRILQFEGNMFDAIDEVIVQLDKMIQRMQDNDDIMRNTKYYKR